MHNCYTVCTQIIFTVLFRNKNFLKRHRHTEYASPVRETLKSFTEFLADGSTPCFLLHCICLRMNSLVAMNPQEQAQCMEWFVKMKLDTHVQRHYRTMHHKAPPSRPLICAWYKQFEKTESVLQKTV